MKQNSAKKVDFQCIQKKELKEFIDSIKDIRDNLSIRILYETGCTLIELVKIKANDVKNNSIAIEKGKAKRVSLISKNLFNDISGYINGNKLSQNSFIISTRQSSHISEKRVRQIIQKYARQKKFKDFNPHMLRYCHVAHAYLDGVYQETIAAQLGINKLRVFQIISELNVIPENNFYCKFLNET
ncbi:MAG: site-specific integrase [archaeon]